MRRKCGTCRYFEEAGIAGSGRCTHPQRADLYSVVLVRKDELACRNPWDDDLWRQREVLEGEDAQTAAAPVVSEPAYVPPPQPEPAQTASIENPTDRVTEIAVGRRGNQMPRPQRWPYSSGFQAERRAAHDHERRSSRIDSDDISSWLDDPEPHPKQEPQPAPTATTSFNRTNNRRDWDAAPNRSRYQGTREHFPVMGGEDPAFERDAARDEPGTHVRQMTEPLPELDVEPEESPNSIHSEPQIHTDNATFEIRDEPPSFASTPSAETMQPRNPIDSVPWAASIPRCCGTCRDFRRNADGTTGICTNPWAFADQTQPMVQSDQLACRSSFGEWWAPTDETWRGKVDTAHHTRPTPYLDALLAELQRHE